MLFFKVFVALVSNYEDPSALSKLHGKSIIYSVDPIFFHATVVTKNHSKDPQRNGTNHGTDIIYRTVLSICCCDYLLQYEVGIIVFYYFFLYEKSNDIGQCYCHWRIPVDILGHFNKIVEQYSKFKTG